MKPYLPSKVHNYGLNLELERRHRKPEDWEHLSGDAVECIALIPEGERQNYLPSGERQNIGEEKRDCASRGPINLLEAKFAYLYQNNRLHPENKKWLEDNGYIVDGSPGFSDRFIAILSGTDPTSGNSMIAPIDAIYTYGLIPKTMFPQVPTTAEYYSGITAEMRALGLECAKRFKINYKRVYEKDYSEVIVRDMINVGGFARPDPVGGIYPNPAGYPANHVWLYVRKLASKVKRIFDNYIDSSDGDYLKDLADDYDMLDYGYRLFISKEMTSEDRQIIVTVFDILRKYGLLAAFEQFVRRFTSSPV